MDGIEHLRRAKGVLHVENGDLRSRLRVAAHEFWSAVFHVESWPVELRTKAEALTARIFYYGIIDEAVHRMGDETVAEVSRDLLWLCEDADRIG